MKEEGTRDKRRKRREPRAQTVAQTMERAYRLLALRSRGVEELRGRLLEKEGVTVQTVEVVIERLTEYRYLDDEQFARDFCRAKLLGRPMGRRRLGLELRKKKLEEGLIERTLDAVFEQTPEETLVRACVEKFTRSGPPQDRAQLKKLRDKLMRRGFAPPMVREATAFEVGPVKRQTPPEEAGQRAMRMDAVVAKFLRTRGKPSTQKEARRLLDQLLRRGFSPQEARERVEPLMPSRR